MAPFTEASAHRALPHLCVHRNPLRHFLRGGNRPHTLSAVLTPRSRPPRIPDPWILGMLPALGLVGGFALTSSAAVGQPRTPFCMLPTCP